MIRVGASDNNMWFGWRVAMPSTALKGLTLSAALARADSHPISLPACSRSVSKRSASKCPSRSTIGCRPVASRSRLPAREWTEQILAYRVAALEADLATRPKVFELAKALNVPMVVLNGDTPNLTDIDALAAEFEIRVALESRGDPRPLVASLEGRSARIGIAADLRGWMQSGITPVDAISAVKDRLLMTSAGDRRRSGRPGARTRSVTGRATSALLSGALSRRCEAALIVILPSGATEAEYMKDVTGFERVMWPAMAERVRVMLESPAGRIRGGDRLEADVRAQIEAATPRQAMVTPARPRKLLVTDIQMYSGHSTIPHGNYLLEQMAKHTGAFEPTFSNDLNLLKYPKIKEFDAIYLNNVCGMVYNDPEVRDGILRFVREGGGIGGHHAVTFANNNWPEFAEMMGGWAGAHHIENTVKVADPEVR